MDRSFHMPRALVSNIDSSLPLPWVRARGDTGWDDLPLVPLPETTYEVCEAGAPPSEATVAGGSVDAAGARGSARSGNGAGDAAGDAPGRKRSVSLVDSPLAAGDARGSRKVSVRVGGSAVSAGVGARSVSAQLQPTAAGGDARALASADRLSAKGGSAQADDSLDDIPADGQGDAAGRSGALSVTVTAPDGRSQRRLRISFEHGAGARGQEGAWQQRESPSARAKCDAFWAQLAARPDLHAIVVHGSPRGAGAGQDAVAAADAAFSRGSYVSAGALAWDAGGAEGAASATGSAGGAGAGATAAGATRDRPWQRRLAALQALGLDRIAAAAEWRGEMAVVKAPEGWPHPLPLPPTALQPCTPGAPVVRVPAPGAGATRDAARQRHQQHALMLRDVRKLPRPPPQPGPVCVPYNEQVFRVMPTLRLPPPDEAVGTDDEARARTPCGGPAPCAHAPCAPGVCVPCLLRKDDARAEEAPAQAQAQAQPQAQPLPQMQRQPSQASDARPRRPRPRAAKGTRRRTRHSQQWAPGRRSESAAAAAAAAAADEGETGGEPRRVCNCCGCWPCCRQASRPEPCPEPADVARAARATQPRVRSRSVGVVTSFVSFPETVAQALGELEGEYEGEGEGDGEGEGESEDEGDGESGGELEHDGGPSAPRPSPAPTPYFLGTPRPSYEVTLAEGGAGEAASAAAAAASAAVAAAVRRGARASDASEEPVDPRRPLLQDILKPRRDPPPPPPPPPRAAPPTGSAGTATTTTTTTASPPLTCPRDVPGTELYDGHDQPLPQSGVLKGLFVPRDEGPFVSAVASRPVASQQQVAPSQYVEPGPCWGMQAVSPAPVVKQSCYMARLSTCPADAPLPKPHTLKDQYEEPGPRPHHPDQPWKLPPRPAGPPTAAATTLSWAVTGAHGGRRGGGRKLPLGLGLVGAPAGAALSSVGLPGGGRILLLNEPYPPPGSAATAASDALGITLAPRSPSAVSAVSAASSALPLPLPPEGAPASPHAFHRASKKGSDAPLVLPKHTSKGAPRFRPRAPKALAAQPSTPSVDNAHSHAHPHARTRSLTFAR